MGCDMLGVIHHFQCPAVLIQFWTFSQLRMVLARKAGITKCLKFVTNLYQLPSFINTVSTGAFGKDHQRSIANSLIVTSQKTHSHITMNVNKTAGVFYCICMRT